MPHGIHVLVIDAQSHDRTAEFARSAGATVVERAWTDFVDARRFALAQVATPWTLAIDADEALDDRLRAAILAAGEHVNGYRVRRDTYFCGKSLRMWRREPLLRLFRTEAARVEAHPAAGGDAPLHETYACNEPTGDLTGTLMHFSYPDLASYRTRFSAYTAIEARATSPATLPGAALLALPRFARSMLARGAFLDGWQGWYVAWMSAWYPVAVAAKAMLR